PGPTTTANAPKENATPKLSWPSPVDASTSCGQCCATTSSINPPRLTPRRLDNVIENLLPCIRQRPVEAKLRGVVQLAPFGTTFEQGGFMTTAVEVMDEASAQTGLTDFGEDSFREGLEILLASLQDEARLHERGQAFLHHRIVGYLSQRLQVEDWHRRHPEI